jgi:hypothetical protein
MFAEGLNLPIEFAEPLLEQKEGLMLTMRSPFGPL